MVLARRPLTVSQAKECRHLGCLFSAALFLGKLFSFCKIEGNK
jgi:hypothetical protein